MPRVRFVLRSIAQSALADCAMRLEGPGGLVLRSGPFETRAARAPQGEAAACRPHGSRRRAPYE